MTDMTPSPVLGVDHPLAVRLRTENEPARLEAGEVPGMELALPVSHRGELIGFVLMGTKPGREPYRPDEVELLAFAAHQVGLDLHALEIRQLRGELARTRAEAHAPRSLVGRDTAGSRP